MRKALPFVLAIAAVLLLASCGYDPDVPMYRESLHEALTPGQYLGRLGRGAAEEKAIMTITGHHKTEDATVTVELYSRDPITEEWDTEPYASYSGKYIHVGMIYEGHRYSDWDERWHADAFEFTGETGSGRYTPEDLSGIVEIRLDPFSAKDISQYYHSHHYVPVTGTYVEMMDCYEYGWTPDDISALTDYRWQRI